MLVRRTESRIIPACCSWHLPVSLPQTGQPEFERRDLHGTDGIMLKTVTRHLKELEGGRIGKIQNLSDEEILFHIHTKTD